MSIADRRFEEREAVAREHELEKARAEVATLKAQIARDEVATAASDKGRRDLGAELAAAEASLAEALDLLAAMHSDRDTHPHALKVAALLKKHGRKP